MALVVTWWRGKGKGECVTWGYRQLYGGGAGGENSRAEFDVEAFQDSVFSTQHRLEVLQHQEQVVGVCRAGLEIP